MKYKSNSGEEHDCLELLLKQNKENEEHEQNIGGLSGLNIQVNCKNDHPMEICRGRANSHKVSNGDMKCNNCQEAGHST